MRWCWCCAHPTDSEAPHPASLRIYSMDHDGFSNPRLLKLLYILLLRIERSRFRSSATASVPGEISHRWESEPEMWTRCLLDSYAFALNSDATARNKLTLLLTCVLSRHRQKAQRGFLKSGIELDSQDSTGKEPVRWVRAVHIFSLGLLNERVVALKCVMPCQTHICQRHLTGRMQIELKPSVPNALIA